jgi:hypothetical protein
VTGTGTHQPNGARDVWRHHGNLYVPRFQQSPETGLARATPCLGDGSDRYAQGSAPPKRSVQTGLHNNELRGVIES